MARIAAKAEAKSLAKQGGDTNDPMSLDEMKKKQVKDDEKNNKPKFLSKAERQAAALKRLEDKRKETDEMREAQRDQSRAFLQGKRTVAGESATERRDRERKEREASIQNREDSRAARERAKDIEVIKASYMGVKKVKKKIIKPSEKFAKIFQFDWEAGDDTMQRITTASSCRSTACSHSSAAATSVASTCARSARSTRTCPS